MMRSAYGWLPHVMQMRIRTAYRAFHMLKRGSISIASPKGPRREQVLANEAQQLVAQWALEPALAKAEEALAIDPLSQKALGLKARILSNLGRIPEAIAATRQLEESYPLDVNARRMLRALGQDPRPPSIETARKWIERLGHRPNGYAHATAYLFEVEFFEETAQVAEEGLNTLHREPNEKRRALLRGNILYHQACSLEYLHRYDEALQVFTKMLDHEASHSKGMVGIARCHFELGRASTAEDVLLDANSGNDDPQPFTPLTLDILQAQDKIEESYRLYRKKPVSLAIAECFNLPSPILLDLNADQTKSKSALIVSEGGPGDELRLCAIYPDLAERLSQVAITTDPRLHSIMSRSFPEIEFIPSARHRRELVRDMSDRRSLKDARLFQVLSDHTVAAGQERDIVCSTLDTLADLRPNRAAFRASQRRLVRPLPSLTKEWRTKTGSAARLNIGIAWRSMLESVARNRHYLSASDLAPLSAINGAVFWILQPKFRQEELDILSSALDIRVPNLDLIDDFEGQFALMANLDLVVSPFMTTGEMSGAAGVPTILVSTTRSTMWRRNPNGTDIWSPTTKIVSGDPVHDKLGGVRNTVSAINEMFPV